MELQMFKAVKVKRYPVSDSTEEQMDMARYRCSIFHMYSIVCEEIYEDFESYRNFVARRRPVVGFIKPLFSGNLECVVYVFEDTAGRDKFLEENREYKRLYNLTKERKVL